jgi:hypothetical protein
VATSDKGCLSGCLSVLLIIGFLVLVVSLVGRSNDQTSRTSSTVVSSGTQPPVSEVIPKGEEAFIEVVQSFERQYEAAPNDLKKSARRTERARAIATILSRFGPPRRWIGTIDDIGTNSEGKAYVSIKLGGSEVIVKTWNNFVSDVEDQTLINQGTNMYSVLSELSNGSTIAFSGEFIPAAKDHIKEVSLTEQGSMTEPEFLIRFRTINPHN